MTQKLPDGAFAYYVGLGPCRNYQAVANHFGVHKRTVVRAAEREEWGPRLAAIEKKAREAIDEKLTGEMQDRHLRQRKLVLAIASRAAKAISDFPLTDGYQGIKAAELAIKLERLLDGETTERTSVNVEALIKEEYAALMRPPGAEDGLDDHEEEVDLDDDGDDDGGDVDDSLNSSKPKGQGFVP